MKTSRFLTMIASQGAEPQLPPMLLRDEFTTDLAAGSVNGTNAEPSGHLRTVVDTGNRLSLSGGKLLMAGGGSAYGQPKLLYPAYTRVKGGSLWTQIKHSSSTIGCGIGFHRADANFSAGIDAYCNLGGTWTLRTADAKFLDTANNLDYQIGVVLRTVGSYFFIKGQAFTEWTLGWIDKSTTGSGYPGISNWSGAWNQEFMRMPLAPVYPLPLASDSFNRADAALGVTDGVETDSTATSKPAWTDRQGTFGIVTNKAQASAVDGTTGFAISTVPVGSANVFLEATVTRSAGSVGLVAWYTDADNHIRLVHNGTNLQLIRRVAGTDTTVAEIAATIGRIVLMTDGTTVRGWSSDVARIVTTVAQVTPTSVCGIFTSGTGNTLDLFTAWNRKAGAYTAFDAFFRG